MQRMPLQPSELNYCLKLSRHTQATTLGPFVIMTFLPRFISSLLPVIMLAALTVPSYAEDKPDTPSTAPAKLIKKVEPVPFSPRLTLATHQTHSGLGLPRWVSLKYGQVNGRKGPGKNYPHLWTFERKGSPVIVINEMDHWRQIRDMEGGESWVRSVALSGEPTAIVTRMTLLLKSPKPTARAAANLEPNLLLKINSCDEHYCRVEIDLEIDKGKNKGPKGYVLRADIWGDEKF